MLDYFWSSINRAADKRVSQVLMQKIHNEFSNVFSGVGCFEGTFRLQVKEGSKPYQTQKQQIILPLGVNETLEWCNSFILVLKANGKIQFCLYLARLNKALIRPVQRGLTLYDILLWLTKC